MVLYFDKLMCRKLFQELLLIVAPVKASTVDPRNSSNQTAVSEEQTCGSRLTRTFFGHSLTKYVAILGRLRKQYRYTCMPTLMSSLSLSLSHIHTHMHKRSHAQTSPKRKDQLQAKNKYTKDDP